MLAGYYCISEYRRPNSKAKHEEAYKNALSESYIVSKIAAAMVKFNFKLC